jgi:hypothetical protein
MTLGFVSFVQKICFESALMNLLTIEQFTDCYPCLFLIFLETVGKTAFNNRKRLAQTEAKDSTK